MTDQKDATPAEQARKFFVGYYKKFKKLYLSALSDTMRDWFDEGSCSNEGENAKHLLLRVIASIDTPAVMWDESSPEEKKGLWKSMLKCVSYKADELKEKAERWETVGEDLKDIDCNDEEEEEEKNNGFPSVLYHAIPTENISSILASGILPQNGRKHVYLYEKEVDAVEVARRHGGDITTLVIDIEQMNMDCIDQTGEPISSVLKKKTTRHGDFWIIKDIEPKYISVG